MLIRTRAIVLHSLRYGDNQIIVDLFTEEKGRMSVIGRLSARKTAHAKKQLFQPLTLIEIEVEDNKAGRLQRPHDIRLAYPFSRIPFDGTKIAIALFLAEFLYYSTRNEGPSPAMFQFIEQSVEWLDGSDKADANFHLVFLLHLSRFLGFFPNLEGDDGQKPYFDLQEGVFTPGVPAHPYYLSPEESQYIKTMMRLNYQSMHLMKLSRTQRRRCIDIIIGYYRLHIPDMPEMKSLDVLKSLFDE